MSQVSIYLNETVTGRSKNLTKFSFVRGSFDIYRLILRLQIWMKLWLDTLTSTPNFVYSLQIYSNMRGLKMIYHTNVTVPFHIFVKRINSYSVNKLLNLKCFILSVKMSFHSRISFPNNFHHSWLICKERNGNTLKCNSKQVELFALGINTKPYTNL